MPGTAVDLVAAEFTPTPISARKSADLVYAIKVRAERQRPAENRHAGGRACRHDTALRRHAEDAATAGAKDGDEPSRGSRAETVRRYRRTGDVLRSVAPRYSFIADGAGKTTLFASWPLMVPGRGQARARAQCCHELRTLRHRIAMPDAATRT
jgi:hypothetical protein